ncbi:unannotated protein [freshwater metagenome]|uniref:Unannotated protein n=1 Tax=freshwater metagenome TaxID=449393 RepID=A0A6J6FHD1_9ZZZZ
MSSEMSASSSSNRNSARAFASSVFPTPVGPAKMNEPEGRLGSLSPARVRRMVLDRTEIASSWPMTRWCSDFSIMSRRALSSSVSLKTGIPVACARTSAIIPSSTFPNSPLSPLRHSFSRRSRSPKSFFSSSRDLAAPSKSWFSMAFSFSARTTAILSSNSRSSGGDDSIDKRRRAPASSMRSIALSGRNRSCTYLSASVAAAVSAPSEIDTLWNAS